MGCGCGKSSMSRTVSSSARVSSNSNMPPQMQGGTFVGRTVKSQDTPYTLSGKPKTVVRRSV
jgi:hypothetical protein